MKEISDVLGPIETSVMQDLFMADAFKKAKEMEKEQIRKAYCDGEYYKDTKLSTDYYNETYGGSEQ